MKFAFFKAAFLFIGKKLIFGIKISTTKKGDNQIKKNEAFIAHYFVICICQTGGRKVQGSDPNVPTPILNVLSIINNGSCPMRVYNQTNPLIICLRMAYTLGRVEKSRIEENKMGLCFFFGFGDLENGEIFHFFLKWNFDGWKSIWKFAKRIIIEKKNYFFHFFSTFKKIRRISTDSIVKTIAQTNIRKKSYGVFRSFLGRF